MEKAKPGDDKMKNQPRNSMTQNTIRIGLPADDQGPRHPEMVQSGDEKYAEIGPKPSQQVVPRTEETPQRGPLGNVPIFTIERRERRKRWSREEYKDVLEAFYAASVKPKSGSTTKDAYEIWREKHPADRLAMDANKLANVRRDIIQNKRLTDMELDSIRSRVRKNAFTTNEPLNADVIHRSQSEGEEAEPERIEPTIGDAAKAEDATDTTDNHENMMIAEMEEMIRQNLEIIKDTAIDNRIPIPKVRNDHRTKEAIRHANKAIDKMLKELRRDLNITEVNNIIYAAASSVANKVGEKPRRKQNRIRKEPHWKRKIQKEIDKLRGELSLLSEYEKGSNMKEKKMKHLERKFKIKTQGGVTEAKEILKQQIQAKAQRIRRYEKRGKFFRQNKIFKEDAKKFYRELDNKKIDVTHPPTTDKIEDFWGKIWEERKDHNQDAKWIQDQEKQYEGIESQEWTDIAEIEIVAAIKKSSNWKAPGVDGIANFWIKNLSSIHKYLTHAYNDIIKRPEECPEWLTQGVTYLLPKTEETQNPKNYRPITCLPTMYKILTSVISERTYNFLESHDLLPREQKGCRRGSYGCKDQLLINKAIIEEVKSKKRNLTTAWIDYKKAFDSVPHSWILKSLEMHRVSPIIIRFMENSMKNWKTTMNLYHAEGTLISRMMDIKSGIFQGDSLSPLLFCISLAPLSHLLNDSNFGYTTSSGKLSHLFYMDDLKTYAKDRYQQTGLLNIVKTFSDDIRMEFGLAKCATATFQRGKLTETTDLVLDNNTAIRELDQDSTYKYLGVNEGDGIQHASMKEKIRKEYYRRVRLVLRSELNATNKILAINALAIPVVTYSMNIINWKLNDLKRIDVKTRKLLTIEKIHHPRADVDRLYIPRSEGGRGLIQLELSYKTCTIGLDAYLAKTKDPLMNIVRQHEARKKLYSVTKEAESFKKHVGMRDITPKEIEEPTTYAKRVKKAAKEQGKQQLEMSWRDKAMHGKYPKRVNDADVNKDQTHKWLRSAGLKAETEGLLIAAQDQSLATKSYHHRIMKDGTDPLCRICGKFEETIGHIISGCPELAKTEYIHRHDRAASYLHWKICRHYHINTDDKYYEHKPATVTENDDVTILWDMPIHTDRTIKANRPDIVIKDKAEDRCIIIDMSVPSEQNTSVKTTEKLSKYKDLEIEITRMWGMRTEVIPVVIGALGLIKKGMDKFIERIPGSVNLYEVQKIALLGTAHIIRKVLSIK